MSFKRILIGVDFNELTGEITKRSVSLAKSCGADVRLLHTEPPVSGYVYYTPGMGYDNLIGFGMETSLSQDVQSVRIDHDKHALEALQQQFAKEKIPTSIALLKGQTVPTILKEAKEFNADLIIVGSHKHSVFYNLFFGSVENDLLKDATIPVMVIPDRGQEE